MPRSSPIVTPHAIQAVAECPCCGEDHVIEMEQDDAGVYHSADGEAFRSCECGQHFEIAPFRIVEKPGAAPYKAGRD